VCSSDLPNDDGTTRPCCIDESLNIVPNQNFGSGWKVISGDWWKAFSTQIQYTLADSPCNDGALYELSGNGLILCKIGAKNDGILAAVDTLEYAVGTHFIFHIWCSHDDPGGGITVDVVVDSIVTIQTVQYYKIIVTFAGCTFTQYKTYVAGAHNRLPVVVAYDRVLDIMGVSLSRPTVVDGTGPPWDMRVCEAFGKDYTPEGYLTALENASGGRGMEFDAFSVWRLVTYDGLQKRFCFFLGDCWCHEYNSSPSFTNRMRLPPKLYLYIHFQCDLAGSPCPTYDTMFELTVPDVDPCTDCGNSLWYSEGYATHQTVDLAGAAVGIGVLCANSPDWFDVQFADIAGGVWNSIVLNQSAGPPFTTKITKRHCHYPVWAADTFPFYGIADCDGCYGSAGPPPQPGTVTLLLSEVELVNPFGPGSPYYPLP
jgi:hypothetical protein